MKFFRGLGRFLRDHWKLVSLLLIAAAAAITVAALVVFLPPALPAIGFFTVFGVMPFLPVMGLSLPSAAAACAAGAAALTIVAGGIFNTVVSVTNFLDNLIRGPKQGTGGPDDDDDDFIQIQKNENSSYNTMGKGFGFNYQKGETPDNMNGKNVDNSSSTPFIKGPKGARVQKEEVNYSSEENHQYGMTN